MKSQRYTLPNSSKKFLKSYLSQSSKSSRASLLIASVGLLVLLLLTFTLPFNRGLFSKLFTKPFSHADMMMGPQHIGCEFLSDPNATPAFCDTFQIPSPGGRGGDLDESKWNFSRNTGDTSSGQGEYNWEAPGFAQFCKTRVAGVLPPFESFFCGKEFNEAEHWMETFEDSGRYFWNDGMIRQPFDFTNRTGIITFESDVKTFGGHYNWVQVTITDQPVPGASWVNSTPAGPNPRNGIEVMFDSTCDANNGPGTLAQVGEIDIFKNYQLTQLVPGQGVNNVDCIKTHADMSNHIEIRLSQNDIQVWATDDDQTNFREIASAMNLNLPFSVGYVHFGHGDYTPEKYGQTGDLTYHWHNLGFDGPILPTQRGYSIPEANQPDNGGLNLGYDVTPDGMFAGAGCCGNSLLAPFTIPNVDLTDATGAFLTLDEFWENANTDLQYRFNGGAWRDFTLPAAQVAGCVNCWFIVTPVYIPVQLSDLVQGNNTLEFKQTTPNPDSYANDLPVSNIDLTVTTSDVPTPPPAPYMFSPAPSVTPFAASDFNVTASVSPNSITLGNSANLTTTITNTTSAPITGKIAIAIVTPTDIDVANVVVDNTTMTFMPGQPMTHSLTITLNQPESTDPTTSEDEWGYVGTNHVIESILSPDGSTIYYTNDSQTTFTVNTPTGSPAPCLGDCPAYSTYYADKYSPTPMPSMSATPLPTMSATPMPSMSSTPAPTSTPTPTPTSTPVPTTAPTPTPNPSACPSKKGDFNGDGVVNLTDLSIFSSNFGTSAPNIPDPCTDLNGDGKVDLTDLSLFAAVYGT